MLVSTDIATATPKVRSEAAIRRLVVALDLASVKSSQVAELTAVLAEVAANDIAQHPEFAKRVRKAFEEAMRPRTGGGGEIKPVPLPKIKPIRKVDPSRFATYGPSDPYALLEQYGAHQLPRVLKKFLMDDIKKSAALVQERNPGTQLKSKPTKADLIEFIVRYVTG